MLQFAYLDVILDDDGQAACGNGKLEPDAESVSTWRQARMRTPHLCKEVMQPQLGHLSIHQLEACMEPCAQCNAVRMLLLHFTCRMKLYLSSPSSHSLHSTFLLRSSNRELCSDIGVAVEW